MRKFIQAVVADSMRHILWMPLCDSCWDGHPRAALRLDAIPRKAEIRGRKEGVKAIGEGAKVRSRE